MHISVEAPSRSGGRSLPGGIQRQQEEPGTVSGGVSADSAQKSALELSNSTISTSEPAQKPLIARSPFNRRNIPIEAPAISSDSSTYPGGIQRLETSGVKEQEESTESLQMPPSGAIQAHSSGCEQQEKEEQNKESVQTKLTVGAPGDKYEQEADSMAAKVMRMPDSAIKPPIQRQTGEETEAVQMQPLVNSITPLVQRSSGEEVADRTGIPIAGQRPAPATSPSSDPRSMRNDDLEAQARKGDQSALDELNYRELVYQRHQEVQRTQPIEHPQSQQRRGLGELPPPTRRTVEASRRVLAFLEATAQSAESARVPKTPRQSGVLIPPTVSAGGKGSFAVNVTEVQTGNGQRGFVVSFSGNPQEVQARLDRLQQLSQELGGEFEFGPAQAGNYATNRQRVANFPGGEKCAEPKSFYQVDGRPVEGTATVWFGKKKMEQHELPGLLDADPSRPDADVGSHGMYMLPCPSCELNSGGMMDRTVYSVPPSGSGDNTP